MRDGGGLWLLVRCTWLRKHTADFAWQLQGVPSLLVLRLARADTMCGSAEPPSAPAQPALLLVQVLASVSARAAALRCRYCTRPRFSGCNDGARHSLVVPGWARKVLVLL